MSTSTVSEASLVSSREGPLQPRRVDNSLRRRTHLHIHACRRRRGAGERKLPPSGKPRARRRPSSCETTSCERREVARRAREEAAGSVGLAVGAASRSARREEELVRLPSRWPWLSERSGLRVVGAREVIAESTPVTSRRRLFARQGSFRCQCRS